MQKPILKPNRLSMSEQSMEMGLALLITGYAMLLLGAFLHFPWIVGGIAAALISLDIRRRRRRLPDTSGIHGTAHFATEDEIAAAGLTGRTDGLIVGALPSALRPARPLLLALFDRRTKGVTNRRRLLHDFVMGKNSELPVGRKLARLPSSDKYAHVACYFSTGIGKTFKLLTPNLFCCNENAVVFDPSGDTVEQTAEFRRRHFGHEIRVIAPFGIRGGRNVDRLNVLDLVNPNDPGCFEYCNHLGHALVIEKPQSHQDPFWHAGTISGTGFLLHAIMLRGGDRHRNLTSIGELLSAERLHELAESLMDHPDAALRRRAQQMLNYRGKTLDSLLACLSAEHNWMDSPAFADALSGSTFSAHDLYRRRMTIYIVIPGHRAVESAPFVRTLLTAILFAGFEAGVDINRSPVRFYLDEAATLGKLDLLMTLYTQGRKYGMRSFNFFQSVGQVAEITGSPEKVQTFRSQMAAELFKAADLQTAKEISEWIGQTTVHTESTSRQTGTNSGWSDSQGTHPSHGHSGGWSDSTNSTISETGVALIRPEEVLQLQAREAILVAAGMPPVKLNILDAADVRACADADSFARQQKRYLFRLRFHALALWLLAPAALIAGSWFTASGCRAWQRRQAIQEAENQRPFRVQPQRQKGW